MKNKRTILFSLLIFCHLTAAAQSTSRSISGSVRDKSGAPLSGVNVTLEDSYDGATTDSSGEFSFTTEENLSILVFELTDYTPVVRSIGTSGDANLEVTMRERFNQLKAVTVSAGVLSEKKISVLNPIDIVTVAGGGGDVSGALKTLPGTQQINDREGLFVRGGSGDETQQFIDGALVRNAFLTGLPNLGSRGRFSPFLFKGTIFSPGGYSAQYGGGLSGAILLESIDMPDRSSGSLNLTALGIGAGYQHLSSDKKFTIGGSYNYTNLGLYFGIVPQLVDYNQTPIYHSGDFNFRKKIGSGILKFYASGSRGDVGIYRPYLDSYDASSGLYTTKTGTALLNQNIYTNLSYKTTLPAEWHLQAVSSYSTNSDSFGIHPTPYSQQALGPIAVGILNQNQFASLRMQTSKSLNDKFRLNLGLISQYSREQGNQHYHDSSQYIQQDYRDQLSAAFAESEIYINNNLGFKIGIRGEYSSYMRASNIAPRVSMAYRMGNIGEFSGAFGYYFQKPNPQYLYKSSQLDFMRARHYILTYVKSSTDRMLRIEAFRKDYDRLISYTGGNYGYQFYPTPTGPISQQGEGYAQGLELYYRDKKTLRAIDYWVSYSFLDTRRRYLNFPIAAQPDFAAQHVASIVAKKFWTKINFGLNASYNFSAGRPYFDPNTNLDNNGQIINERFMQQKSPNYGSLNLSANYLRQFGSVFSVFVVSVTNVLNQDQIYGYNFSQYSRDINGDLLRSPVLPGARQFLFLGAFFSIGVDRSQEAINNNL